MEFRTELSVAVGPWQIGWKDPILTLGSCFADSMGVRLERNKFNTLVNPFGVIYHPLGLHKVLKYAVYHEYPAPETYHIRGDIHVNFDFHSSFSGLSHSDLKERLRHQIAATHYFLKDCQMLLITYGTAWIYERRDTGESVANCHKLPSDQFVRRLSSVEELSNSFKEIYSVVKSKYPQIRIILTVSPVRHIKDTLPLNAVSKATLRLFCEEISSLDKNLVYFPAYEIMMDDLRDYRFYHTDMIHPSAAAESYIWEKFSSVFLDATTRDHIAAWSEISKALQHRPFQADSKAHIKFLQSLLSKLEKFQALTNIEPELARIKSMLTAEVQ